MLSMEYLVHVIFSEISPVSFHRLRAGIVNLKEASELVIWLHTA